MTLFFRVAVYLPVLLMIAMVVVAQDHTTARETIQAAVQRTVRWTVWTVVLLALMLLFEMMFIGW